MNRMTLNEFINHIKHNSLEITINDNLFTNAMYIDSIGSFKTSIIKSKIGDFKIIDIIPYSDDCGFYIKVDALGW